MQVTGELPGVAGLLKESGLVASMNEARRAIAEGGAYVNNERVTDVEATVDPARAAARPVPGAAPRQAVLRRRRAGRIAAGR